MRFIQIVLNSDRIHVSIDGRPERTYMIEHYIGKEMALTVAKAFAYDCVLKLKDDGFEVTVLETKTL